MSNRRGFTLIEVLLALVVTVASGMLLADAWSSNYGRVRKTTIYNNVALLLEKKMAEIEAKNTGKKILEISEEEGNFGDDLPDYRWTFKVQPFEMPDYGPILQSKSKEGVDATLLMILGKMRDIANKQILEGTVTVYVKTAKKEIPFSVTTYFIDYDSDIGLTL